VFRVLTGTTEAHLQRDELVGEYRWQGMMVKSPAATKG
jgi:hypothetical protein